MISRLPVMFQQEALVLDSAIRELSEELGIKASPSDLIPIGTHEGKQPQHLLWKTISQP